MRASTSAKRIGIFGGSFDPPHLGHEALALVAIEKLALDELWVVPAGVPVHRELTPHIDAATRLKWVRAMFAGRDRIRVLDWEVSCSSPVAAVETLHRFCEEMPGVVPLWICGADSYAGMTSWVDYPAHRGLCNVAIFARAGEPAPSLHAGWKGVAPAAWLSAPFGPGHVVVIDSPLPDISATQVRRRAVAGDSLDGLVNGKICKEVGASYRQQ